MKQTLGELEQTILLDVLRLGDEAYGSAFDVRLQSALAAISLLEPCTTPSSA
jgi:hypothetical protein